MCQWQEGSGYLDFQSFADRQWTYRAHPVSGQQHWFKPAEGDGVQFQDLEESYFIYPEWWKEESWEESSEEEGFLGETPPSSSNCPFPRLPRLPSSGGEGSNNKEAHVLLTAFRHGHPMFKAKDRFILHDRVVIEGIPSEIVNVSSWMRQGPFEFVWREYLASRDYRWPEAQEMALEKHATALDYNDEPQCYLVVTFKDSEKYPWRALVHPRCPPLFEKDDMVFAKGLFPQSYTKEETIRPSKPRDIFDSFKGTHKKRQARLKFRKQGANAEAGEPDGFNKDIEKFLLQNKKLGLDEAKMKDEDGHGMVHLLWDRVRLHPETHRWTADPELEGDFWAWLTSSSTDEGEELMRGLRRMGEVLGALWNHFKDPGWPRGDALWERSGGLAKEIVDAFSHLTETAQAQGLDCREDFGSVPRQAQKVVEAMTLVKDCDWEGWWKYKERVETLYAALNDYAEQKGLFGGFYRSVNNRRLFCIKEAFRQSPVPPAVRVIVFPLILGRDRDFQTKERVNFLDKLQSEMEYAFIDGEHIHIRAHSRFHTPTRVRTRSPVQEKVSHPQESQEAAAEPLRGSLPPEVVRPVPPFQLSERLWRPMVVLSDYDCHQEQFPHEHLSCQKGQKMQIIKKEEEYSGSLYNFYVTARPIGSSQSGLVPVKLLEPINTQTLELGKCLKDYSGKDEEEAGFLELKEQDEILLLSRQGAWGFGFSESSAGWFPLEVFSSSQAF